MENEWRWRVHSADACGKYDMISTENYDKYLETVGVGIIKRGLANKAKPTLEWIDLGNNKWTQKTYTMLKNFEITYVLGEEFDENTADDRVAKSVITLDGNTLTHKQRIGDQTAVTTRVFSATEMTSTFSANGVTAKRVFKRVA